MKHTLRYAIFSTAFLVLGVFSFAQQFTLLKDINSELYTGPTYYQREPLNLTEANGTLFFNIYGGYGSYGGLWRTDGTDAGTVRVKDVFAIEKMLSVNGTLFFTTAGELWKSDGSEVGTVLVKNVPAIDLINVNGTLFFTNDAGLWKSDGTENGTILVKAVGGVKNMTNVNGILFFNSLRALWKSDGTDAGTVIVSDSFSEYGDIKNIVNVDGIVFLFFTYYNVPWLELWRSDGTQNGTSKIMTNELGGSIYDYETRNFTSLNRKLYFFAGTTNGTALWQSDGTAAGTFEVKVLNESSYPQELFVFNGSLFFSAFDQDHGMELWKSDGTSVGTQMLKDIFPGYSGTYPNGSAPGGFFNLNGTLYFTAYGDYGSELWKSDGTAAGTITVGGLCRGPSSLTNVNGVLFFVAAGLYGREIWKSNGTAAGTIMVKDIFATGGSNPREFVFLNGVVYFAADPKIRGYTFFIREQLFRTDGTVANTFAFSGLSPMSQTAPQNLTVFKGQVFFSANDNYGRFLWKSDGTSAGTVKVKPIDVISPNNNEPGNHSNFCVVNQTMFFSASEGNNPQQLWKTDGTDTGTVRVNDTNGNGFNDPQNLTNVNGVLMFTAKIGSYYGLFRSDGTAAGTQSIQDFYTANGKSPAYLTVVNKVLYFTATDAVNGTELWKTDGTYVGTQMVRNIKAGNASSNPSSLTNINGVLFFAADDGINGTEIWKSDGTEAGTSLIKDIRVGNTGSNPTWITNLNGMAYFSADDGSNARELWRSNGTAAGTTLLDIWPGPNGSDPSYLTRIGNNILFSADNGITGSEVWMVNNATSIPRMMGEIEPGHGSSSPTKFFEYGSKVLVAATNSMVGDEVWIADMPSDIPILPDALITAIGPLTVCGGNVLLQANAGTGYSYQWEKAGANIPGAIQVNYTATSSGVYTVVVTDANGGSATADAVAVTISAPPVATIVAAGPVTFCVGKNVILRAGNGTGYMYQWKKAGVNIDNATASSYVASAAGSYSVLITNAAGCTATSQSLNVTINPVPLADVAAGGATTFCEGKTVQLKAISGNGYTYQWKRGATDIAGATLSTYNASSNGFYTVIVTNANGCSGTSSALPVVVKPLPAATITPAGPTTFCSGKSVLLRANTGTNYTYQWVRGATPIPGATQANYSATQLGFYTVIVTNTSGCSVTSDAVAIYVNPVPVATITPVGSLTFCAGQSVLLRANTGTGYTFQWKKSGIDISGANQFTYSATASGVYSVVVTNAAGCSVTSSSVTITVNNVPLANIAAASATTFCPGKSVLLKAINGAGYTYQWKKNNINIVGETTSNYTATTAGYYSVVVTNATGCSTTSSVITVATNPSPLATVAAAGPLTFCEGKNVLLKAIVGTGYTYQWKRNGVNIPAQTQSNFTATTTGVYTVAVTNAEGCLTFSSEINVIVTPLPSTTATANGPLAIPQGGNVLLSVPNAAGSIYQWKKDGVNIIGATAESYTATESGIYTVTITNINACQSTSQPIVVSVTQGRTITKGFNEGDKITVYPNPLFRNDYLNIDWNINSTERVLLVNLYDAFGGKINSQLLQAGDTKVKISGASGFYIVECRWGINERKIFKVLKVE